MFASSSSRWGLALLVVIFAAGGITTGPCGKGPECSRLSLFASATPPRGVKPCRWYPKKNTTTERWVAQAKGDLSKLKGRHLGVCGTNDNFTLAVTFDSLVRNGTSRVTWKLIEKARACDQASHKGKAACEKLEYCQFDPDTHVCAVHGRYYDMEYRSCPGSKAWEVFYCMARFKRQTGCNTDSRGKCRWLNEGGGMCLSRIIPANLTLSDRTLTRWWDQNLGSVDNEAQFWTYRSQTGRKEGACEKLTHSFKSMQYSEGCWNVNYLPDTPPAAGQTAKTKRDRCLEKNCNWLWFPGEQPGEPPFWECRPHTPVAEGLAYGMYWSYIKEQATQCYDPDLTERGRHACETYELY